MISMSIIDQIREADFPVEVMSPGTLIIECDADLGYEWFKMALDPLYSHNELPVYKHTILTHHQGKSYHFFGAFPIHVKNPILYNLPLPPQEPDGSIQVFDGHGLFISSSRAHLSMSYDWFAEIP